ncbi:MAG: 2-hydroxyacid dehydrogenase [Chloroherpetonaceae bacterium]|nr:2-hydroxyacid dehydrogenase [Chloroherpetonaceae bacterium]MCS7210134.1 2-hydroxyacid dehydrogenase [Chloroherpetonaceae bacterium]MDW8019874.1 2-hydroxyacid dehydrogenase [Chloroherpetonaceae bacterium]
MKITFFDSHTFERDFLIKAARNRYELNFLRIQLTTETVELAKGSNVVSLFVNDDGSAPILEKLASFGIKHIALRSAGFNHVDLDKARELGIRVANVPAYSPFAVAEHTVALMLALNRKLPRAYNRVRDLNFSLTGLVGFDMNGKTAGIIGTGKIGSVVVKILHGFGCRLLGYDIYPNESLTKEYGLEYVDLDTLFRESHIITLHTPLTPETKYLINEHTIAKMRDGVMLINTSRGGLVKTEAALDGLRSGKIGYLGLDVYEEEKGLFFYDRSSYVLQDEILAQLLSFPNVIVTSHQGFLTDTALRNIADTTFETIDAWACGKESPNELVMK